MNDIVDSVQRVSDIITEITAASSEQSNGIGQVNQAVIQIDDITQQNAALVEQAAAAAGNLAEQTRYVSQAIGIFKLQHSARLARTKLAAVPTARPPGAKPKLVAHG